MNFLFRTRTAAAVRFPWLFDVLDLKLAKRFDGGDRIDEYVRQPYDLKRYTAPPTLAEGLTNPKRVNMPLKQSRVSTPLVDVWPDRKHTIAFASPLPAVLGRLADIYRQPWYLRSVGSVLSRTARSGRLSYLRLICTIST